MKIPRKQYASLYGPTTGDRVRLADTDLIIEVEDDLTVPGKRRSSVVGKPFVTGWGSRLERQAQAVSSIQ